jgi:hypothetical protein
MTQARCLYQDQASSQTLKEGIEEYFRVNPHLLLPSDFDEETKNFFVNHDKIHVIFGCNTSFSHEVRADFWTVFGTDIGFTGYMKYAASPVVRNLYKDVSKKASKGMKINLKAETLPALKAPVQVLLNCRRMKKKWPWSDNETLMNRPLSEIRQEYGIRVLD